MNISTNYNYLYYYTCIYVKREKPWQKCSHLMGAYIPCGCAQTMWSHLYLEKQKWHHLPVDSHNNKQPPHVQLPPSTFTHHPLKHCK